MIQFTDTPQRRDRTPRQDTAYTVHYPQYTRSRLTAALDQLLSELQLRR